MAAGRHAGYGAAALHFAPEIGYYDPSERRSPPVNRIATRNAKDEVKNNAKR
jgi:hypothetical protein